MPKRTSNAADAYGIFAAILCSWWKGSVAPGIGAVSLENKLSDQEQDFRCWRLLADNSAMPAFE